MEMNEQKIGKLAVTAGLLCATNGVLLLATPGRFATLRTMGWMPQQYNDAVTGLAEQHTVARVIGAAVTLLGVLLVLSGIRRVEPSA